LRLRAHDDVALLERGAQRSEVVLAQLVLVGERLDVLLLDEAALGGLLEQVLGRREIVQVNRVAQLKFLSLVEGGQLGRPTGGGDAGRPAIVPPTPCDL
jgi:hypothetical protein